MVLRGATSISTEEIRIVTSALEAFELSGGVCKPIRHASSAQAGLASNARNFLRSMIFPAMGTRQNGTNPLQREKDNRRAVSRGHHTFRTGTANDSVTVGSGLRNTGSMVQPCHDV